MRLFFSQNITDNRGFLSPEDSRHVVKSLRMKAGDEINITDGKGICYSARIEDANFRKCTFSIYGSDRKEKNWNFHLHIAIAPTKNIDRFEWFLEKATELGIDEITPILTDNSERKRIKMDRCERILQSAMKQSHKFTLPKINELIAFSDFIENTSQEVDKFIAHCYDGEKTDIKNLQTPDRLTIVIGPEGDFTQEEVSLAQNANFTPLSLGRSRLRTETAAVFACNAAHLNAK
jgi:16S rRNA (uracil1498-N3)-methyltransferase